MSFRWNPLARRAETMRRTAATAMGRTQKLRRRFVLESLEDRVVLSTSIPLSASTWTPIGPVGITTSPNFGNFGGNGGLASGRIVAIATDPINPNIYYVAAAGGGVWKTTNGGTSWKPLTDHLTNSTGQPIPEFMGSIAVAPSNGNVIYAGTGEANNALDSFYGEGVLKSSDGGNTWTLEGQFDAQGNPQFEGRTIGKIVISPTDPNTVYAAVSGFAENGQENNTGIWKSTDGGVTWTNTTTKISTFDSYSDLIMDPNTPTTLFAAVGTSFGSAANGVYVTTDGGTTWAPAGNFPAGLPDGRISLAMSKANSSIIYASIPDPATGQLKEVDKSIDGGKTWTALSNVPDYLDNGQGWYDTTLAVSPTDPNEIFAGGVVNYNNFASPASDGLIESIDGGTTWTDVTVGANSVVPHTDHHAAAFDASGKFLDGDDGGIWRLENPGQTTNITWTDLNNNLNITQFTGIALNPLTGDIAYGGSQDNGTEKFNDNGTWTQIFGGDGGFVQVDPNNPQTVYIENTGVSLERSVDGGQTFTSVTNGINPNGGRFYTPFEIDPADSNHLVLGTNQVYESNSQAATWKAISTPNTGGWNSTAPITTVAIGTGTIYASTDDGKIFVTTNDGGSWTERDITQAPHGSFPQLLVDPTNPLIVYAVNNTFNSQGSTGHVFKTTDGGQTWQDLTGTLPDVPTWSIAVDNRANNNRIYVGTDEGVWSSSDGGATWAQYKTGMPNAQVVTLDLNPSLNILAAGTHGRGVFEIVVSSGLNVQVNSPANAIEGTPIGNTLIATFTDPAGIEPLSNYSASITWGDGKITSQATIVPDPAGNGLFDVFGNHTYADEGRYTITVAVQDTDGASGQSSNLITVGDAPLTTPSAFNITGTEEQKFSGVVTTFVDTNPFGKVSDFTATIDWGDGHITTGKIVPDPVVPDEFDISGSNTYVEEGTYFVDVTINDVGGSSTTAFGEADIADAPLFSLNATVTGTEGLQFTGTVATFTDTNLHGKVGDYLAIIDWGDGTPTAPDISLGVIANSGVAFTVKGTHLYKDEGNYPVKVQIFDAVNGQQGPTLAATPGTPENVSIGFTPYDLNAAASNFIGLIDWGDGTPTAPDITYGTVTGSNGSFTVSGTHSYATTGNFPVGAVLLDLASSTTPSPNSAAVIHDAGLAANSTNVNSTEGQPLPANTVVASFTDGNPFSTLSDFTGTSTLIDWGDGTLPTPATIVPGTGVGVYNVLGDHTYAEEGTFTITVTIRDVGGSSVVSKGTATVVDAPLTASGVTGVTLPAGQGTPVEGTSFDGATVATFTDEYAAAPLSDYSALIDWGDGTSSQADLSAGTVQVDPTLTGVLDVLGGHDYHEAGSYTITITISDIGTSTAKAISTIQVQDAPLTVKAVPLPTLTEGNTFNGPVATFHDGDPFSQIGDFLVAINWGNGLTSGGTLTATGNGNYTISGSNTYADEVSSGQPFPMTITIFDLFGASPTTLANTVTVADAPLAIVPGAVQAVEGTAFNGPIATLVDGNPNSSASDFTTTINWGDGHTSAGTLTPEGNGVFLISGGNTYAEEGNDTINIQVTDIGGAPPAQAAVAANVQDAPLTALPGSAAINPLAGNVYNGPVVQFNDANAGAPVSDFTAMIDWGDGQFSSGQIVSIGGGNFQVNGSNTYTTPGNFSVSVTINDQGGSSTTASASAQVLAPLTAAAGGANLTNNPTPSASGTAQAGLTIRLFAQPSVGGPILLGQTTADGTGHWSLTGTALADGVYILSATMSDQSGQVLQTVPLGPLVIDTHGPSVVGTVFDPGSQQLRVTFQDAVSGMSAAGLTNLANYSLTLPSKTGTHRFAVTGLSLVPGAPGTGEVTAVISYNLGKKVAKGNYVVELNALGLTDNVGNALVEKFFVAFPQSTNAPNPNYIAQFAVNGKAATTPEPYVPLAEQIAAAKYSKKASGKATKPKRR